MKIGFILTPACKLSDVINSEAMFRLHPLNKIYFIAEESGIIIGKTGLGLEANTTFETCPKLDVFIVGQLGTEELDNLQLIDFLKGQSPHVKYIVGISNGVMALHKAGIIKQQQITSDSETLNKLKALSLNVVDKREIVIDGKLITAGPSTGALEATYAVISKLHGKWLGRLAEFSFEYEAPVQYPKSDKAPLPLPSLPKPLNVGIFVSPETYLPDMIGATEVFGALPNSALYYVSDTTGIAKSTFSYGPNYLPTITYDECPNLDVLIVGATHPKYLKDKRALDFIIKQEKSALAVISVCAGTLLVGSTGLLKGKNATTNLLQIPMLPEIGVKYDGQKYAVDGKFLSAGPVVGSFVIGLKAVENIVGREWAQYIEQEVLEFEPKPLWGVTMKSAGKRMRFITRLLSFTLNLVFTRVLKKGYMS